MNPTIASKKGPVDTLQSPFARWHTLARGSVKLDNGFWGAKQRLNQQTSLEHGYRMLEKAGNFENFRIAAGLSGGVFQGREFHDSDVYKWLEAAAHELAREPNPNLQAMAEAAIELVGAAQQPDGYLDTYYQVAFPGKRWTDLDHGHELYCAGHLFQGAVAYHRATGDDKLLNVAIRFADYIDSVFGADKRSGTCGHPEVEMALVELYRETREIRYLNLAKFFIDERGKGKMRGLGWLGPEYHQDRVPVRQSTEIEGHAVRALYLMSGVTDLYMETGEQALFDAVLCMWQDMNSGKLYITGGAGAHYEGEAFGNPYELPNEHCYCETCAAIASIMWNWRMLLATGEAQFADLMERTLYNGFLSGLSIDGQHFFYINPLLSRGGYTREGWYPVACCPPNIMRTLASFDHLLATTDASGIQLHFYNPATIQTTLEDGCNVSLKMETEYPWQGKVKITVSETANQVWKLRFRIPGWSQNASVTVNGQPANITLTPGSYAAVERVWQPGDVIEIDLAMQPHFVEGHPLIEPTRNSVAIQRGPLVYCLEQGDQETELDLLAIQIDETKPLEVAWQPDLLDGIALIHAAGYTLDLSSWGEGLYRPLHSDETLLRQPVKLTLLPYCFWGNRVSNAMRVWIPRTS